MSVGPAGPDADGDRSARTTAPVPDLALAEPFDQVAFRPTHFSRGEPPARGSWPNARGWPELRERSVDWFELHPDDRVVPVPGEVDPATYWD